MFLRRNLRSRGEQHHAYWTLVESVRTERGPRQRVVAYLGDLDDAAREAAATLAHPGPLKSQASLFEPVVAEHARPQWAEVDVERVRVERPRSFGGVWLGLQVVRTLELDTFLSTHLPRGREDLPWATMALVLVLARLCEPGSELSIAERWYPGTALPELLGIPPGKVNDDRLYRALDQLLPCKAALEKHLKNRLGELFALEYDLILYDVTSTFFEGQAERNPQAQRGYSRDSRPDCKQVCVALIVSREGLPLGYEVFAGNRGDVTTVEEIVETVEKQYGKADRIWVMDRGMVSEANLEFMRKEGRRYLVGTPRSQLRHWERELRSGEWSEVHAGLEVQLCPGPDGVETFILCRSAVRREKEQAIHERAAVRLERGLEQLRASCAKRATALTKVHERVGRLRERHWRASRLFRIEITADADGTPSLSWERAGPWNDWAALADGCYVLRSNVSDWTAAELWRAYIQLTEAEAAFRIHKSDLSLRPVWHQTEARVKAHILVCFLAYVLWKTLGKLCQRGGLGDCPRRVLEEISTIRTVDVVLPTRGGVELRKRCITEPEPHQAVLLQRLGLLLPKSLPVTQTGTGVV